MLSRTFLVSFIAVETHLERLDLDRRTVAEQAANTLTAYIGKLEDRLEQGKTGPDTPPYI